MTLPPLTLPSPWSTSGSSPQMGHVHHAYASYPPSFTPAPPPLPPPPSSDSSSSSSKSSSSAPRM
ncbi:uncharacterized protein ACA1_186890 [Acanthamoeba castellanii str. Neff]|uniref:Uncharacterized protein n=1 Tax=Acanthamoeba castellanii (strain ATCC 30010 / Neff) TaxID=1257118 RepID=L8H5C4_ACACF|nr:uncharacterized protein ACA1_186890 [Acanthamoeba castellanii str. Neff]ELR20380.1 hypothetical protein ACA1_186890 [Acanthamoeba castellanii str. Neff]